MTPRLAQMIDRLAPEEQTQVENFAAFLLVRNQLPERISTDEITTRELLQLVSDSGAFDWLADEAEDVYSMDDGEPVRWPTG